MEELEALLAELETPGSSRGNPAEVPRGNQEQLYSSVRKPLPPRAAPPPALGELERLLLELSDTESSIAEELLASPLPHPEPPKRGGRGGEESPDDPEIGGNSQDSQNLGQKSQNSPKSAATMELERLMTSLSEFNLQGAQESPKFPGEDLESLLDLLQKELRGFGVAMETRGTCRGCGKPILGKVLRALGSSWHPEHFVCAACERPVLGALLTALGRPWHPEHFCCTHCGERLGEEGFMEHQGLPYCRRDFGDKFGVFCCGCGELVLQNFLAALGGFWHPECFVCQECRSPFPGGLFYSRDGIPLCRQHVGISLGSETPNLGSETQNLGAKNENLGSK